MSQSKTSAIGQFVRRLLLRSALTAEEQDALLDLPGRILQVGRGHQLVVPGNPVDHATLLIDGLLGRYDQMVDGSRQITTLHIPGDMSDLHSVPLPVPAWGIEALAPSTVMQVPHQAVRALAAAFPPILMAFWRDTVTDASILAKWTANLGRADAAARLAHLICEIGVRLEVAGLGRRERFALPLTQGHMADILGITSVHVNRTLMGLRQSNGLLVSGGFVETEDWRGLAKLAGFDPEYLLLENVYAD